MYTVKTCLIQLSGRGGNYKCLSTSMQTHLHTKYMPQGTHIGSIKAIYRVCDLSTKH